jgi:hypothetical protein
MKKTTQNIFIFRTLFIVLALSFVGCGDDTAFVEVEKTPPAPVDLEQIAEPVKEAEVEISTTEDGKTIEMNLTQAPNAKVDILWVIDNSASMKPLQTSLRQNISAFIQELTKTKLNFNIGITTTDVCDKRPSASLDERRCPEEVRNRDGEKGSLVGKAGLRVMKSGDADVIERFGQNANLGTNGSSFEHGLTAVEMAVKKSLGGENDNFVREGSFLSVIVVSDEEDDGVGLGRANEQGINYIAKGLTRYEYNADHIISYLDGVKGRGHYGINAITGTRGEDGQLCKYPNGTINEEGAEYILASQKSAGMVESICDQDWSRSLQRIGEGLNAQIDSVVLPKWPTKDSIRVHVDGELYSHWTYVVQRNSIQFEKGFVPAHGAQIKIVFTPVN